MEVEQQEGARIRHVRITQRCQWLVRRRFRGNDKIIEAFLTNTRQQLADTATGDQT